MKRIAKTKRTRKPRGIKTKRTRKQTGILRTKYKRTRKKTKRKPKSPIVPKRIRMKTKL